MEKIRTKCRGERQAGMNFKYAAVRMKDDFGKEFGLELTT